MCLQCDQCCRKVGSILEGKKNPDGLCCFKCIKTFSQISTISTMPGNSHPNVVYRRKKFRANSEFRLFANGTDCNSLISSDGRLVEDKEQVPDSRLVHVSEIARNIVIPLTICDGKTQVSELESCNGCTIGEGHRFDERTNNNLQKNIEVDSMNDSCSSSKSNVELVSTSMKVEGDDAGECSSSSIRVVENIIEDISGRDLCISILRSNGLLHCMPLASIEESDSRSDKNYSRSCKICGFSESVLKMLICDHCEDAFHVSCCHHRMKKVPNDEWYCNSCLKKKHKFLKDTIIGKLITNRNGSFKGESNPIALMLKDNEPYTTRVCVGKGFQAEVPDWSGPIHDDTDAIGEPLEMDLSESFLMHEQSTNKPRRLGSIGNWLQCQQVVDRVNVNEAICGKWRRAPLFEVQTDNWECFCSILWDPTHADCAVPQELETVEVLKQLKYIEMLRPRLAAKRRKLDETKSRGDLQNQTAAIKHKP